MRRSLLLLVAVVGVLVNASLAWAGGGEFPDPLYGPAVASGGWLTRAGWTWPLAHDDVTGGFGSSVRLILIDSGVDLANPDFLRADQRPAYNAGSGSCVRDVFTPYTARTRTAILDVRGHGSTVAALAAAPANGEGFVGAAPLADLVIIRVPIGVDLERSLACALRQAHRVIKDFGGYTVVNLSMQFDGQIEEPRYDWRPWLRQLVRDNALVIAAAGNRVGQPASLGVRLPASESHVLAIGDAEGVQHYGGPKLDLVAPGSGFAPPLLSTHGYQASVLQRSAAETSWAAAVASGIATTLWSRREATPQQVAYLLRSGADRSEKLPAAKGGSGFGEIDLAGALARTAPRDDEIEPNDTAADASAQLGTPSAIACHRTTCRTASGILDPTDDPTDWWLVAGWTGARGPCVRVSRPSALTILGAKRVHGRWAIGVRQRGKLLGYRIRPVLCGSR